MERAAAIWDLDGVIVDSGGPHYGAWRALAERRGQSLTRERFAEVFGLRNDETIRELFGPVEPGEAEEIERAKEWAFREAIRGNVRPLPGALELLGALRESGHRQALATSSPRQNAELILAALGVSGCFDAVVCGEDVARGKPNPAVFRLAAHRIGAEPLRSVVIEDAVVGVEAAIRAGMRVVAVTTTRTRDELARADRVVDSLLELGPDDFVVA